MKQYKRKIGHRYEQYFSKSMLNVQWKYEKYSTIQPYEMFIKVMVIHSKISIKMSKIK